MKTEIWPDDVKRVKDAMDLHAVAGMAGNYMVCSLQTGKPVTNDCYPSRMVARRFAERKTTDALLILQVAPDGMTYKEAEACLKYERTLYAAGFRTPDHFETEENSGLLSMPHNPHDQKRMIRQLVSGRPLPGIHSNIPTQKG